MPDSGTGKDSGECVPQLLAAAVRVFDAYYLLEPLQAGSGEWLEKWDARLTAFLHTPDQEGYSRQVLCGEEDYGSTDLGAYVREKRKGKVRLAFLRLLLPLGLKETLQKELEEYLVSHTSMGMTERITVCLPGLAVLGRTIWEISLRISEKDTRR